MKKLIDILWSPRQRDLFAADLLQLVEDHVRSRSGLRGAGIRAGLAMLKTANPDLLARATQRLAPEFIVALQPLYEEFLNGADGDFSVFLQKRSPDAVARLLGVADARIAASSNTAVKSVYGKMRGFAEDEVASAIPALGRLIRGYL